jgi:hypothetical protein
MRFFDNHRDSDNEDKARIALKQGLKAHHFVRMTAKDAREQWNGREDKFECSCGLEFAEAEQLREHQDLRLRIYLGISEKVSQNIGDCPGHKVQG